ncbi:MAG: acetate/propionate family kinase [Steroidobacteraceae bacterium]
MGGRRILVLNAGSSSLKFAVFEAEARLWHGQVEGIGTRPRFLISGAVSLAAGPVARELPLATRHEGALREILGALAGRGIAAADIAACGHRIVHGGAQFVAPMIVDQAHLGALNALRALAPLHNGFGLAAIDALRAVAPALAQVACFDTAFHATVPEVATRYALPAELQDAGYRRFGFHGLNFEHVTAVLTEQAGGTPPERLLILHLGNGCSIAAVEHGRSIATTMGYSTLDGLVMGTRCGAIDPGVLLALQRDRGLDLDALEELLYRRSGLLGLSGRSSDMRELERISDDACRFAVEHFCYWAARHAGSLAVALGGVDALAFTGGIGTGSSAVRQAIVAHLAWLGFELDGERNRRGERSLAAGRSRGSIWRVEADEELAILRHVYATLDSTIRRPMNRGPL